MDRYRDYVELSAHEREGSDYRIVAEARNSPVVVLAPHGGSIEPTTSAIAAAIAGHDHSLYCFEGLSAQRPHSDLHITSELFDEPRARTMVANALFAVHGRRNRGERDTTWLGGLDRGLIGFAAAELSSAGFKCLADGPELSGKAPANICNATQSGRGLQLELPRDLRDRLRGDTAILQGFAAAIRAAIASRLPHGSAPR